MTQARISHPPDEGTAGEQAVQDAASSGIGSGDPGQASEETLAATRERIRVAIASFGGASRLSRRMTEECGDPIGESGVRAWIQQCCIPLRRLIQMANLGRPNGITIDMKTLEVRQTSLVGGGAFMTFEQIALRWGVTAEQVAEVAAAGDLPTHVLAGEVRVAPADILAYERRARRGTSLGEDPEP